MNKFIRIETIGVSNDSVREPCRARWCSSACSFPCVYEDFVYALWLNGWRRASVSADLPQGGIPVRAFNRVLPSMLIKRSLLGKALQTSKR